MTRTFAKTGYVIFLLFSLAALQAANPVIAVDGKDTLDFGTFPANVKQSGIFKIQNKGDAVLKIGGIRKTCGCSIVKIEKEEIPPGGSSALTAEILTESISGLFSKNIYVESNDPKQRFLQLNFTGKAVPLLTVYPKPYLYIGALATGKTYEYKFRIESSRDGVKMAEVIVKSEDKTEAKLLQETPHQFTLSVKTSPHRKNTPLSIEIEIQVLEPSGWKPLLFKLQGRTAD
jgi:hypothetical protein